MSPRAPNRPLSSADSTALGFLAEHRVGIAPQLAVVLGVSRGAAERRVRRLAERGLVRSERVFSGCPPTVQITRSGLRAIDSRLPEPTLTYKGYRHDIGVGWLWLAAHRGSFGELAGAVSERRMQSADARLGRRASEPGQTEPYGIGVGGAGPTGLPQRHYPDMVLRLRSAHTLALELELTGKGPRRLAGIVRGYAADPRIDAVLYLVTDRRIGDRITAAARTAGVSGLIRVAQLAAGDSIEGAPRSARRLHGTRPPRLLEHGRPAAPKPGAAR